MFVYIKTVYNIYIYIHVCITSLLCNICVCIYIYKHYQWPGFCDLRSINMNNKIMKHLERFLLRFYKVLLRLFLVKPCKNLLNT